MSFKGLIYLLLIISHLNILNKLDRILEEDHASYIESVPFKVIATFTIFQLVYFVICFGVTQIPIFGILFPLPFFILVAIRQYVLPKFFNPCYLHELDAAEYEEITGMSGQYRRLRSSILVILYSILRSSIALKSTNISRVGFKCLNCASHPYF